MGGTNLAHELAQSAGWCEGELASLRREAETELAEPGRWGTTFTLIQCWGRLEG